jgi:hypothetical protein
MSFNVMVVLLAVIASDVIREWIKMKGTKR